jgi:hypothetical protein
LAGINGPLQQTAWSIIIKTSATVDFSNMVQVSDEALTVVNIEQSRYKLAFTMKFGDLDLVNENASPPGLGMRSRTIKLWLLLPAYNDIHIWI